MDYEKEIIRLRRIIYQLEKDQKENDFIQICEMIMIAAIFIIVLFVEI